MEYLSELKDNFYTYKGRLNRKAYIIRYAILIIIVFINRVLVDTLGGVNEGHSLLFNLIVLLVGISIFMIDIRRIHDLGKSGYWVLLMLVPLLNIAFLIYLFVAKGNDTENEYGPNPLDYIDSN